MTKTPNLQRVLEREMPTGNPKSTVAFSRHLRRTMTEGEKRLWRELRLFKANYGLHVRRQAPVGIYIADFAIHAIKLIIEVDGEHHFTDAGMTRDARRDAWFAGEGYAVVRFTTGDLDGVDGCVETILAHPRVKPLLG